ncbi:hypothetical protein Z517_05310 [Fonsecaea pedrosoi CBS 271.37]|uniref:Unplaced genomic scaffold supercont1.3, whole genome shotgun sequence n=1 Tax=Fonsecaea pedrosoi CBS 271.37 TaxID=1442368 RepID=A0A0D2GMT7_9EURO|nr:uncharacterized protein Z517_05310 [Fonsecaea pedrosoi CBS 271.37]KIW82283.1 hypothetical protein Z517_05310 [Fonsecaea pedrosoi CBS 271.37]
MTGPFNDAASLISILHHIRDVLSEDAELSHRVGLQIKETGQNEKRRYDQLLNYQGPDDTTLTLLQENHTMIRRCTCILLYEFQARHRHLPLDHPDVIRPLTEIISNCTLPKIRNTIKHMITVGSRLKNLEKVFGPGVAVVVGCDIAESTWSKVLPKKDDKFNKVIDHWRSTSLPELARKYASMQSTVIESQLCIFERLMLTWPGV